MARPLTATDEEILEAAEMVMVAHGPQGFSVSKTAKQIGLSRTAIAQRFPGSATLKLAIYARATARMEAAIAKWRIPFGGEGLLEIARQIGRMVGGKSQLGAFMARMSVNIDDPVAREMEIERGRALREVIIRTMPATAVDEEDAVDSFMANITGALIAWQASAEGNAETFLVRRTKVWLSLAGIEANEAVD